MKALVGAFNQEKALVGAFSVIVKTDCETDGALHSTNSYHAGVQAWQGGPDAVERHHPQRPDVRQDEAAQDGR